MNRRGWRFYVHLLGLCLLATTFACRKNQNWESYASDKASTKYSSLAQISADNVSKLKVVWRQSVVPGSDYDQTSQNTPLMVDGLLYISTGLGTAAALDAGTGQLVWSYGGEKRRGLINRSLAFWRGEAGQSRVFAVIGSEIVALDARSGEPCLDFGENGSISPGQEEGHTGYFWTSPPLVVGDVLVVGSSYFDYPRNLSRSEPPGDVRGYDVRTGDLIWVFHTIPREGEYGNETWLTEPGASEPSWKYTGQANMWAWASADEELGYIYLPLGAPTSAVYGGHRPGGNLFANSIVCIKAASGERVWHFQAIHHDLWDYDFPAAPVLADIVVEGRPVKALAAVSKQAYTYVLDRVTGEPVWPIEERPVPTGTVPGEWYAPTQPIPSKPPPFDLQGVVAEDLIDFTPELRSEALQILDGFESGPLYTPPTLQGQGGLLILPGIVGGANWGGAGLDPESGVLYVPTVRAPKEVGLVKPTDSNSDVDYVLKELVKYPEGPQGLPLVKPPYGQLVAIDLNQGEILWSIPNGDGPRDHPALKHLNLPPLGQPGRVSPLVTKSLVFLGEGTIKSQRQPIIPPWGGGKKFRAYDKRSGKTVWETTLDGGVTAAPMTYMLDGRQYIVVTIGWPGQPSEYLALALP